MWWTSSSQRRRPGTALVIGNRSAGACCVMRFSRCDLKCVTLVSQYMISVTVANNGGPMRTGLVVLALIVGTVVAACTSSGWKSRGSSRQVGFQDE